MNQAVSSNPPAFRFKDIALGTTALRALALVGVIGWLLVWHLRSTHSLSIAALLCLIGFVLVCVAYGTMFERITGSLVPNRVGVTYRLLTGFFTFNTLLFILALASPFGLIVDVTVLAALALIAGALASRFRRRADTAPVNELPGLLCILGVGAAATLWASELQPAMEIRGSLAVFRAWRDIFIHVGEISAFAQSHGLASMSDIKMAGAPAPAYHFASYISTAALSALTSMSSIAAFGSFQLPMGILLMGLAAFVLIGSLWGVWPALLAAVAVVTLPDAYEQGFGSTHLGFHFMSQVNLGMLYGIACVSIAWLFMLEGCRRASYAAVAVAYGFLLMCVMYKAQLFVANAFLLLIFPCVFFAGLRLRWRLLVGVCFILIFVATVRFSQQFPRIPTIRLDGSGLGSYIGILLDQFKPGIGEQTLRSIFYERHYPRIVEGAIAALMILFCSFGIWILVFLGIFWKIRNRVSRDVFIFPILVIVNYMVMALGLAVDDHQVGNPEELLNRPMAWAYFIVVTFTIAGIGSLVFARGRVSRPVRWSLVGLVGIALAGVGFQATDFQTMPAVPTYRDYANFNAVPLCRIRAAEYIRDHGRVGDVMQDSQGDLRLMSTAIAERQLYVARLTFGGRTPGWDARLRAVDAIERSGDAEALRALATRDHIAWYLLHPTDAARWPQTLIADAAFECGGYRVIRLAP